MGQARRITRSGEPIWGGGRSEYQEVMVIREEALGQRRVEYSRAVVFNPGPQGQLSCMFYMFPCFNTPDSNEWVVTRLLQS